MTRYGYPESDDDADVTGEDILRRYIPVSMQHLKNLKFTHEHEKAVNADHKLSETRNILMQAAKDDYDRKKEAFMSDFSFKPRENPGLIKVAQPSESEISAQADKWRIIYEQPSSTAAINCSGIVGESETSTNLNKKDCFTPRAQSTVASVNNSKRSNMMISEARKDMFDISLNSTNASSVMNNTPPLTKPGDSFMTSGLGKQPLKLELLSGRPSFAPSLFTSTPLPKPASQVTNLKPSTEKAIPSPLSVVTQNVPVQNRHSEQKKSPTISSQEKNHRPLTRCMNSPIRRSSICEVEASLKARSIATVEEESLDEDEESLMKATSLVLNSTRTRAVVVFCSSCSRTEFVEDFDLFDDLVLAQERFNRCAENQIFRNTLKRSIVERITMGAKKKAQKREIEETVTYLSNLLDGHRTTGFRDQTIQIGDADSRAFAVFVMLDTFLTIVERDASLIDVTSSICSSLCSLDPKWERILLAHIFTKSHLLGLDSKKCMQFVDSLPSKESDVRLAEMNKEKGIMRLFVLLNVKGDKRENARFSTKRLWSTLAFALNNSPRILATVMLVNQIADAGSSCMQHAYPTQWPKLLGAIQKELLPNLETALFASEVRRSSGEALHISVLRNTVGMM